MLFSIISRILDVRRDGHDWKEPIKLAARFIYLNKTCFNGLYRVNKSGRFNVPIGSNKNPVICDEDNLLAVAERLKDVTLQTRLFDQIKPKEGDLVYCDPPYDGTFTKYTSNGFDTDSQIALRNACLKWINTGVHVIVSNSDTPLIRNLYERGEFQFVEVQTPRTINSDGKGRGKITELLIHSMEDKLDEE